MVRTPDHVLHGMVTFEVAKLVGCNVCGESVIYLGPQALERSKRLCSDVCGVIDDQVTPGTWIEVDRTIADRCHDRPDRPFPQN